MATDPKSRILKYAYQVSLDPQFPDVSSPQSLMLFQAVGERRRRVAVAAGQHGGPPQGYPRARPPEEARRGGRHGGGAAHASIGSQEEVGDAAGIGARVVLG